MQWMGKITFRYLPLPLLLNFKFKIIWQKEMTKNGHDT